jgi:sugar phosphate isomerase/epimerase
MGPLKISCALWSLTAGPTDEELERAVETVAGIGIAGVQLWCVDEPKWKRVTVLDPDRCTGAAREAWRKRIESHGVKISGFCAQLAGPTALGGFGEREGLDVRLAKTQKALRLAADMGSPIVTTHVGEIPEDRESEAYRTFLESVGAVAKSGEECGAVLAIETGQESAETLRRFIEDVGSPAIKVNYDPANMLRWGTVEGVGVLADYIVHTHAKDRNPETRRPTVGQGAVKWDEYLAALARIGYDGWYAIEDESGKDVVESIRQGYEFLRRRSTSG